MTPSYGICGSNYLQSTSTATEWILTLGGRSTILIRSFEHPETNVAISYRLNSQGDRNGSMSHRKTHALIEAWGTKRFRPNGTKLNATRKDFLTAAHIAGYIEGSTWSTLMIPIGRVNTCSQCILKGLAVQWVMKSVLGFQIQRT